MEDYEFEFGEDRQVLVSEVLLNCTPGWDSPWYVAAVGYCNVDRCGDLIWGLLGYTIFQLAPGFGLPPELPGMRSAPVNDRQIWWVAAVAATAGGLALIFLAKQGIWKAVGIALIALPHLIGAPHPHIDGPGALPAELAASFVSASLPAHTA